MRNEPWGRNERPITDITSTALRRNGGTPDSLKKGPL
jgi:hypothetical protein